jgi:hypothetical protein
MSYIQLTWIPTKIICNIEAESAHYLYKKKTHFLNKGFFWANIWAQRKKIIIFSLIVRMSILRCNFFLFAFVWFFFLCVCVRWELHPGLPTGKAHALLTSYAPAWMCLKVKKHIFQKPTRSQATFKKSHNMGVGAGGPNNAYTCK